MCSLFEKYSTEYLFRQFTLARPTYLQFIKEQVQVSLVIFNKMIVNSDIYFLPLLVMINKKGTLQLKTDLNPMTNEKHTTTSYKRKMWALI
jgi:hypothetical protein